MSGYLADSSESDEELLGDDSSDKVGFILEVKNSRNESRPLFPRRRSLKRPTPGSSLQKTAPSPIHPDIDISLTHHISSSDLAAGRNLSMLSRLPLDYFAPFRQLEKSLPISELKQSEARLMARGKLSKKNSAEYNTAKLMQQTKNFNQQMHLSGEPQVISDVTTLERAAATTFSKHYRLLEDGLALTQTPRLLIEADCPHRVVHANAAFSQSVIGTSSNIQRWIERQNSSKIRKNRKLGVALRDIVTDTDIHLIVYPVLGSEKVTHFLVETAERGSLRKKRRRGNTDEVARAVG